MRKAVILFCLMVPGILVAQVTFNSSDLNIIAKGEKDIYARKFSPGAVVTSSTYDVKYYSCFWNIDPSVREISGSVCVLFKPLNAGFDSLVLDMSQALLVDSVKYRNNPSGSWSHSADLLVIRFANPLPPGTADSVSIFISAHHRHTKQPVTGYLFLLILQVPGPFTTGNTGIPLRHTWLPWR